MSFDKNCKYHKSCGYSLCHGEGVCKEFERRTGAEKPRKGDNMAKPIPKKLIKAVLERDDGICQSCGRQGANIHHIAFGGTGRARRHIKENLITLMPRSATGKRTGTRRCEWTYQWSRQIRRWGR